MKKNVNSRIFTNSRSEKMYESNLLERNHKVNQVMKILLLRNDFQSFFLSFEAMVMNGKFFDAKTFKKTSRFIRDYLHFLIEGIYFKNRTEEWKRDFYSMALSIIIHLIEHDFDTLNKTINYPNISLDFFYRDLFKEIYEKSFLSKDVIMLDSGKDLFPSKFYGKFKYEDWEDDIGRVGIDREKVCQITFTEGTKKEELIQYIKKTWQNIEGTLKFRRPKSKASRTAVAGNLMRDIEIYNKYQEFKDQDFKYPDRKVRDWFKDERRQVLEPNTIRKIVSGLQSEIEKINCEK